MSVCTNDFNKRLLEAFGLEDQKVTKLSIHFGVGEVPMVVTERLTETNQAERLLALLGDSPPPKNWMPVVSDDLAVNAVTIGKNDKLVIRTKSPLTREARDNIAKELKQWCGDREVICLQPGMSLDIVTDVSHLGSTTREYKKVEVQG